MQMTRHKLPATVIGATPVILGLVEGVVDAAASLHTLWAGRYSDFKHGRRKRFMVFGYALSNLARPLFGLYVDERERGTAFGWYHPVVGISAIPAGVLFGAVWHYWNAGTAFIFAGALSLLSALLLRFRSFRNLPIGGR
jgi:hypothetical protein